MEVEFASGIVDVEISGFCPFLLASKLRLILEFSIPVVSACHLVQYLAQLFVVKVSIHNLTLGILRTT